MGITGELVRSVFSRNTNHVTVSFPTNFFSSLIYLLSLSLVVFIWPWSSQARRRWSSVRSYICGHEFNSVLAEEDSSSVRSSEATVTQPISSGENENQIENEETEPNIAEEKHNSISKLFHEEDAAMVIQSAFRHFLVWFPCQNFINFKVPCLIYFKVLNSLLFFCS